MYAKFTSEVSFKGNSTELDSLEKGFNTLFVGEIERLDTNNLILIAHTVDARESLEKIFGLYNALENRNE